MSDDEVPRFDLGPDLDAHFDACEVCKREIAEGTGVSSCDEAKRILRASVRVSGLEAAILRARGKPPE